MKDEFPYDIVAAEDLPKPQGQSRAFPSDRTRVKTDADLISKRGGSLFEQATDYVLAAASAQKDQFADYLTNLAEAIDQAGQGVAAEQRWLADPIDRGTSRLHMLADGFREKDLPELVDTVRVIARRQPVLFAAGTIAVSVSILRVATLVAAELDAKAWDAEGG